LYAFGGAVSYFQVCGFENFGDVVFFWPHVSEGGPFVFGAVREGRGNKGLGWWLPDGYWKGIVVQNVAYDVFFL
jgi:hypothetical protein